MIFGSERMLEEKMKAVMKEYGLSQRNKKARLICKGDSMEDANKKAERSGLGSIWFTADSCKEIKGDEGLDLAKILQDTDIAISMDGSNYLAIDSEIRDKLLR